MSEGTIVVGTTTLISGPPTSKRRTYIQSLLDKKNVSYKPASLFILDTKQTVGDYLYENVSNYSETFIFTILEPNRNFRNS